MLLMPHISDGGSTPNECSTVSVEEHVACGCDCSTSVDDCSDNQRFVPRECRCVCSDTASKLSCQSQGKYWDDLSCSCLCLPRSRWTACSTGYAFNPSIDTCTCVSISEYASSVLEILIVVLVSSMAMITFGLVQCYRTKTGLFREEPPEVARRISETSALRVTTTIRRNISVRNDDTRQRERNPSSGTPMTPRFMTLSELRALFRSISRSISRTSRSQPDSPTINNSSDPRSPFLSPPLNPYIPMSEATSRSQSSASVTTTADDISNSGTEIPFFPSSNVASPINGPSRITTISEALNELDADDEDTLTVYQAK